MKQSAHQHIYESLRSNILSGTYKAGDQLPTEPVLAAFFHVSVGTLRRATERLELAGYVRREQGRGTFISNPRSQDQPQETRPAAIDFGVLSPLQFQQGINQVLFGGESYNQILLPSPTEINPEISKYWQRCSLVQLPLTMLALPEIQRILSPLPEELGKGCPEEILRECRTFDGELRLMPIIANPTVTYCWTPGLKKAGIKLTKDNWTFLNLPDICRKLKNDENIPPFILQPFPLLLFEPFLQGLGARAQYANLDQLCQKKPFMQMLNIIQTLNQENLAWSPYGKTITIQEICSRPMGQIMFCGPNSLEHIIKKDEWELHPLPDQTNCTAVLGLAVPANAPEPSKAFNILQKLQNNTDRLAQLPGCAPAMTSARERWAEKIPMKGKEAFLQPPTPETLLTGKSGYELWKIHIYELLLQAAMGVIPAEKAFNKICKYFETKYIKYTNFDFLY